ncbi:MAG: hypothetical protein OXH86_17610 [Acidimicrobiaceae bacterium]|nr:hypothetical protein [Acidimicrobiaceae bacterium]
MTGDPTFVAAFLIPIVGASGMALIVGRHWSPAIIALASIRYAIDKRRLRQRTARGAPGGTLWAREHPAKRRLSGRGSVRSFVRLDVV